MADIPIKLSSMYKNPCSSIWHNPRNDVLRRIVQDHLTKIQKIGVALPHYSLVIDPGEISSIYAEVERIEGHNLQSIIDAPDGYDNVTVERALSGALDLS